MEEYRSGNVTHFKGNHQAVKYMLTKTGVGKQEVENIHTYKHADRETDITPINVKNNQVSKQMSLQNGNYLKRYLGEFNHFNNLHICR